MHIRYLITLAGAVMLSSTALASDRMNGGFERAQAGSDANIGASGANTSSNAQRNGVSAGQSSTGIGTGAQMQQGRSITGGGSQNAASNAAEMATVDSLPDAGRVTLRGIVQDVDGEDEFTLSDSTGSIEVELSSSMDLEQGQTVTVVGDVGRSWGKRQLENAMVSNSAAAPGSAN